MERGKGEVETRAKALIEEYLCDREYADTLECFKAEQTTKEMDSLARARRLESGRGMEEEKKSTQVNKADLHESEDHSSKATNMIQAFRTGNKRAFFRYWGAYVGSNLKRTNRTIGKLYIDLHVYFATWTQREGREVEGLSSKAMDDLHSFLVTEATELLRNEQDEAEYSVYFGLPHVRNPKMHASFSHLFQRDWCTALESRLLDEMGILLSDSNEPGLVDIIKASMDVKESINSSQRRVERYKDNAIQIFAIAVKLIADLNKCVEKLGPKESPLTVEDLELAKASLVRLNPKPNYRVSVREDSVTRSVKPFEQYVHVVRNFSVDTNSEGENQQVDVILEDIARACVSEIEGESTVLDLVHPDIDIFCRYSRPSGERERREVLACLLGSEMEADQKAIGCDETDFLEEIDHHRNQPFEPKWSIPLKRFASRKRKRRKLTLKIVYHMTRFNKGRQYLLGSSTNLIRLIAACLHSEQCLDYDDPNACENLCLAILSNQFTSTLASDYVGNGVLKLVLASLDRIHRPIFALSIICNIAGTDEGLDCIRCYRDGSPSFELVSDLVRTMKTNEHVWNEHDMYLGISSVFLFSRDKELMEHDLHGKKDGLLQNLREIMEASKACKRLGHYFDCAIARINGEDVGEEYKPIEDNRGNQQEHEFSLAKWVLL